MSSRIILGPQGEEIRVRPDSSVAAGTERGQEMEYAVGPQGEQLFVDELCPTCGQPFPESASQPEEDPSPDATVIEDDIDELSA
jgi:hypothetical protein